MIESKIGNVSINGKSGKYNLDSIQNENMKHIYYGMNAADEFVRFVHNVDKITTVNDYDINIAYTPVSKPDEAAMSMLGFAYEILGNRTEVPLKDLDSGDEFVLTSKMAIQNTSDADKELEFDSLDLNNDKKIDVSEAATFYTFASMFSGKPVNDSINVSEFISKHGIRKALSYLINENKSFTQGIFIALYQKMKFYRFFEEFKEGIGKNKDK